MRQYLRVLCFSAHLALIALGSAAAQQVQLRAADSLSKITRYPDQETWARLPTSLTLALAGGESESGQVAVRAMEPMELVAPQAELSPLRHAGTGYSLPPSPEPIYAVAYLNPLEPDPEDTMWPAVPEILDQPDPLRPVPPRVTLQRGETLTLWVTVTAPVGAPPGEYRGHCRVSWQELAEPVSVALQVHVWDVALPASTAVQTQLFGINMGQVARYCGLDPQPTNPQWADAVAQCVNLYRNYRISPAHAAFADLSGGYSPSVVPGRLGKAARFDGYVTRLAVPLPPRLVQAPQFTLMCWFRPTRGDPRTQFLLSSWHQGQGLRLEYRGGGSVAFYGRQAEPVAWHAEMAAPVAAGEWHHVAVVRERSTTRLYLDGVQEGELPDSPGPALYPQLLLGTCTFMNESLYSGDLDEVRAFDRALDASAIRREMAASAQGSEAPVKCAFDTGLMGYPSPYSPEGASLLRAWWQFWRSEGLHLGNMTAPGAYKWDHVDFRTAKAFFDAFYPWLEVQGLLPYSYTRMPVDEALAGRGREVNLSYGRWLGENYPEINRHHTIGDAIEDERFDDVIQYAGLIDIWDFTPGVWQHRGQRTVAALERRRREHGDRFAWYMTRSSPALRNGVPLLPLDLRGFFWQMMKHEVNMASHWAVNLWDPPTGKHSHRDLQWFEQERCYRFRRSTAAGVASATFLWPSASGPLPSIRWAAIRDGIEDFDLWWLVKQGAERAAREGVQVQGLDELRARVDGAPLLIVGLLGFSTDFGGEQAFRDLRAELARVAVRLNKAGLLPEADSLPPPPQPMPWRWLVDER